MSFAILIAALLEQSKISWKCNYGIVKIGLSAAENCLLTTCENLKYYIIVVLFSFILAELFLFQ